jgi:PGM1 C-terminal domain
MGAEAILDREFVYPTVRCLTTSTAHPGVSERPAAGADDDRAIQFTRLQERLTQVEADARAGRPRTLVIVPSQTIDKWHVSPAETQAYEERMLFSLLELRDPGVRLSYVTSSPVAPDVIDYYLRLLPRRMRRHARSRLTLVALGERTTRPLSEQLLERPAVLERIRRGLRGTRACHMVPYNTTALERDVALALDIPIYGCDPRHLHLSTKSGGRALFARAGIPHPAGMEDIRSLSAAVEAIVGLRRADPRLTRLVVKLNEGLAGDGNAIVDLAGLPESGAADEPGLVAERVQALAPEAAGVTAAAFLCKLAAGGGVIEEWITGRELRSPSVQLRITPSREVQLLSTHDQILGGPSGQSYLGCRFPAEPSYAPAISSHARRIGDRLADAGVLGRFAIDFVVTRDPAGGWQPFAIELNVRSGGTTHPYETLASLSGGSYDAGSATFVTPTGQPKHYVATDHVHAPELRSLGRDGVIALARDPDVRFDRMRQTGAVFHMLSSLDELGRTGFTAIADSADEANHLYERVQATLLDRASRSLPASGRGVVSASVPVAS